jgi:hypothetical protein
VIKDVKMLDKEGEKLLLTYTNGLENSIENFRTNIVIASFVTMYGRVKLYKLLALVDNHPDCELIYFDTVSKLMDDIKMKKYALLIILFFKIGFGYLEAKTRDCHT